MLGDDSSYDQMDSGIDRITQILQRQSQPKTFSPYQSQASGLPSNILDALAGSSYAFGRNHPGSDFVQNVQKYETAMQDRELGQQQALLNAYQMKLRIGDAKTKALDDKISLFTGDDAEGKALFLQELHNDPDPIDPTNSYQVMTKLAGIAKRTGYVSPDLQMQRMKDTADVQFKMAQARKMSRDAFSNTINLGGSNSAVTPSGMSPSEQNVAMRDLYSEDTAPAQKPSVNAPRPLFKGNEPYTDGLEKGYQWAMDSSGKYVSVKIPQVGVGGEPALTPQKRIGDTVNSMMQDYQALHSMGADISTENSWFANKINQLKMTEGLNVAGAQILPGGQDIMKGTESQAAIDRIKSNIPALLLDLKPASEAGAKQFDSDRDVKFMMQQASNPTNDYASNMIILNRISKKYIGQNLPIFFNSEVEANDAASNFPPGTLIFINGKKAVTE